MVKVQGKKKVADATATGTPIFEGDKLDEKKEGTVETQTPEEKPTEVENTDPDKTEETITDTSKDISFTGSVISPVTQEMIRLSGSKVAAIKDGPGILFAPAFTMIFKSEYDLESFVARGATLNRDATPDADVSAAVAVLASIL